MFASRFSYRRPLFLVVAATATVCIVLAGSLLGWQAYENRPMRKTYTLKMMPDIGLKGRIKTERIENSIQYIFAAMPISDATAPRLDEVVKSRRSQIHFDISLQDDGGFDLCHVRIDWRPTLGEQGKYIAITGRGSISDCPIERYKRAKNWGISFIYPSIVEVLSPKTTDDAKEKPQKPDTSQMVPHSNRAVAEAKLMKREQSLVSSSENSDVLTGADIFTGEIETLSGKSFHVLRHAEQMTLASWEASDKVTITCTQDSCLITNRTKNQSVHARPIG